MFVCVKPIGAFIVESSVFILHYQMVCSHEEVKHRLRKLDGAQALRETTVLVSK